MTRVESGVVREDRAQNAEGIFDTDHPRAIGYVRHGSTIALSLRSAVNSENGSAVLKGSTKVVGESVPDYRHTLSHSALLLSKKTSACDRRRRQRILDRSARMVMVRKNKMKGCPTSRRGCEKWDFRRTLPSMKRETNFLPVFRRDRSL